MSPEYVRLYVKAQKNDDRDPEVIAKAATRPTMRFVKLKSEARPDMQTLQRVRDRLVGDWTALIVTDQLAARQPARLRGIRRLSCQRSQLNGLEVGPERGLHGETPSFATEIRSTPRWTSTKSQDFKDSV
jgi:transposase